MLIKKVRLPPQETQFSTLPSLCVYCLVIDEELF